MNNLILKSTLRKLRKNKFFTGLNVVGLAIGVTSFLVLQYYISFEQDYDSFIPNKEDVYRVVFDEFKSGERVLHSAKAHSRLSVLAPQEISEIEQSAYALMELNAISYNDKNYNGQKTYWVAGDFVEMMGLELINGESKLKDPYTCLVSEKWANAIFQNEDPVGKELLVNGGMNIIITGVYKDLPSNTHFEFDNLMSIATWDAYGWIPAEGNWDWVIWWDYVRLKNGMNPKIVEKKLNQMGKKYLTQYQHSDKSFEYSLQPVAEAHFANDLSGEIGISTRKSTVNSLKFISLLVLIIALVNFINIETALINKSQHYIANLKKLGASKQSLISTAFIRNVSINLMAVALAFVLFKLTSGYFANKLSIPFNKGLFNTNWLIGAVGGIIVAVVVVTTFFSSIASEKIKAVENKKSVSYKHPLTRLLVGGQFTIAIVLIVASVMVLKQVRYMQNANLGINLNKVICLTGSAATNGNPERGSTYKSFRNEVLNLPFSKAMTYSVNIPGQSISNISTNISLPGSQSDTKSEFNIINADDGFIETFGAKLLAGRNFASTYTKDSSSVLITALASKKLGFKNHNDAINKEITDGNNSFLIVGVVNDFHHEGLKNQLKPIVIYNRHPFEFGYAMLKTNAISPGNIQTLSEIWSRYYPGDPFLHFFNDTFFNKQYNSEIRFAKIIIGFTLLAIFVAIFGLFGMVTFVVQERTKEIGVRKVNGATTANVLQLMNREFANWVIVSLIIASPLAFYVVSQWLQSFAYKTTISWWVFVLAGITALSVTVITVSWLSLKAARRNPMEVLRYE